MSTTTPPERSILDISHHEVARVLAVQTKHMQPPMPPSGAAPNPTPTFLGVPVDVFQRVDPELYRKLVAFFANG